MELCAGPEVGGTTPAQGSIIAALELGIPVFPLARPRGGDFLYGPDEWVELLRTVRMCRRLGCPGVVAGAQLSDRRLDAGRMCRIVDAAGPMSVTCHKVFDQVPNDDEALETLIGSGCRRVLTSGLAANALSGARTLHRLVASSGGRITVMPGGGVRSTNIRELVLATGAREFHSSAITGGTGGFRTDEAEVRALIVGLNQGGG